ncbi:TSC22 domain family protein 2-like isoform X1 [Sinocyclocheilus anshuiensis]|uniref:TSC22 domain family protein 2-like n=1 Tax=Sinocyclocheilus anshuiensis TaxID=1608454 RepID=A0A671QC24_9TELE|nr:PREDICTED: TSC22 domain family protein 2-like isoform X1 [Sinocyclocheilus anshuiensis]
MSKMPSKKKSCFQITSVTQAAQVAANSNTDDPDDPRTEDMSSSEIYDTSKAGDFEPETCDVSLSDESLHNEAETSGASAQDAPITNIPGSRNASAVHINPPVRSVSGSVSSQSSVASNAPSSIQTSSVSSSATVSSCSSRFRVIKLDHGTGEPFKRGRWTCTEFYERDTDASSSGRTVDSVKHASAADHSADRDGLGVTRGSVAVHVGSSTSAAEPHTDSGYLSAPSNPPVELQQQTLGISQQGLGLVAQNNHIKSPSMPLATQPQPFFPGKQMQKPGQIHQSIIPSNQSQTVSVASLPLVTPLNQGPSPVMTPAAGSTAHVLELLPQPVDGRGLPISQPEHVLGLLQQQGISTALGTMTAAAVVQQAPVPLIQPAVTVSVCALAGVPGVQNVPAVMSSASNALQSMPKQTQQNPTQGVHGGSLEGLGAQTTPANFSQFPTGVAQAMENQRKPDGLLQSSVLIGKYAIKPLNPEGLQLHTPAVNSLFGMAIPIDGDEDSASGASVVAIDNKIEQAMDLVKSHLMYAVREEVEVLKEQIKELYERNSLLERENAVLKSLANTDQLTQLTSQHNNLGSTSPQQTAVNAILQEGSKLVALPPQPNVSTA